MSVLKIEALEKQNEDTVIFPAFGLEMSEGQAVALHSNTNIRNILLRMLNGDMKGSSGDIHVLNKPISTFTKPDYTCIGVSYLDDGLYPRLTVKDVFAFYGLFTTQAEPFRTFFICFSSNRSIKSGSSTFPIRNSAVYRQDASCFRIRPCLYGKKQTKM